MTIQLLGFFESRYNSIKKMTIQHGQLKLFTHQCPDEWRRHALSYELMVLQKFSISLPRFIIKSHTMKIGFVCDQVLGLPGICLRSE